MKSKIVNALMFAAGAAIGSAVTWKIVKDRYERIVQEEIESIKEAFIDFPSDNDSDEEALDDEEDLDIVPGQINWEELEDLEDEDDDDDNSVMHRYTDLANNYSGTEGGAENVATRPYVISPDDFGELDDYEQVELTYYADGILEDDRDWSVVTNVDELVGEQSLYTFGDYEEDSVFVRNEKLRTDFQILKDYRTYEYARGTGPVMVDDE